MAKIKKFLFVLFTGVPGVLLTLYGLNIIQFTSQTQSLILYLGIFLLVVAFISSILPAGTKKPDKIEEGR